MKRRKHRTRWDYILYLLVWSSVVYAQDQLCVRPDPCDNHQPYPDPQNCQRYYTCVDGVWDHRTCNSSEAFDVVRLGCGEQNQVTCIDCSDSSVAVIVDVTSACNLQVPCIQDAVFGTPDTCTGYMSCMKTGNWEQTECTVGMNFDIVTSQCVGGNQRYKCQPPCDPTTSPPSANEARLVTLAPNGAVQMPVTAPTRTVDPAILVASCAVVEGDSCTTPGQIYPDVFDCGAFFICVGSWKKLLCTKVNSNEFFDAVSNQCRSTGDEITCGGDQAPCVTTSSRAPTTTATPTSVLHISTAGAKLTSSSPVTTRNTLDFTIMKDIMPTMTTTVAATTMGEVPRATTIGDIVTTTTTVMTTTAMKQMPITTTIEEMITLTITNSPETKKSEQVSDASSFTSTVLDTTVVETTTTTDVSGTTSQQTLTTTDTTTVMTSANVMQTTEKEVSEPPTTESTVRQDATPSIVTTSEMAGGLTDTIIITTDDSLPNVTQISPSTIDTSFVSQTSGHLTTTEDASDITSEVPIHNTSDLIDTTEHELTTVHIDWPESTVSDFIESETTTVDDLGSTAPPHVRLSTEGSFQSTVKPGYCPSEYDEAGVTWPSVRAGELVQLPVCPGNYQSGYVLRACVRMSPDVVEWEHPRFDMCVDPVYQDLLHQAEVLTDTDTPSTPVDASIVLDVVAQISYLTANDTQQEDGMRAGNLNASIATIDLLSRARTDDTGSTEGVVDNIAQEIIETTSLLLTPKNAHGWESLLQMDADRAVTLMNVVDSVAQHVASAAEPGGKAVFFSENVVVDVVAIDEESQVEEFVFEGFAIPNPNDGTDERDQRDSIAISMETLENLADDMEVDTLVLWGTYYHTIDEYLPVEKDVVMNSHVISLSIYELPVGAHLDPPIHINFTMLNKNLLDVNVMCSFWNYTSHRSGHWSSEGCRLLEYTGQRARCECDHLTNFAVLISPYVPDEHHLKILSLITVVGCLLSIIGCFVTICLYIIAWKRIASEHALVMLNLCVVLILANGLFLGGIERTDHWLACTTIAALLHYLYLCACMIMLADGVEFVLYVMYVFHVKRRKETVLLLATCYIVPATIVGISLSVTKLKGYGTEQYCWLAKENGLIVAFVGPVVIITLANFIILVKVLKTAASSKARENRGKFWSTLWNVTVILPLLGITWIFGIIAVSQETVALQYVFAICNSLQGFFIFLFHCALNKKLRDGVVMKITGATSSSSSMRSTKSGKSAKSKKSDASNQSDKSGKSDMKKFLPEKKKKTSPGKQKVSKADNQRNDNGGYMPYTPPDDTMENGVYTDYVTPSHLCTHRDKVAEAVGENDLYCDIIEANMNPINDLNKGLRWRYDKNKTRANVRDHFEKMDERKHSVASRPDSIKSFDKKNVAAEFLIMEPEYINSSPSLQFIDNRAYFDDTAADNEPPYLEIDNLVHGPEHWTRFQISHDNGEGCSHAEQPEHWIRYHISKKDSDCMSGCA